MYLDGLVIHTDKDTTNTPIRQVVVPMPRRPPVLKLAHDSDLSGHCGVKCTFKKLLLVLLGPTLARMPLNMYGNVVLARDMPNAIAKGSLTPLTSHQLSISSYSI